jgi:hypothetical protein
MLPVSAAYGASAPSAATTNPVNPPLSSVPLSLGFSPSSLYPVADGVPVYTVGDTIWAQSNYSFSVPTSVTSAKAVTGESTAIVSVKTLSPGVITPLYTFASGDVDGVWNITLTSSSGTVVIPVRFVNLADHPVSLGPLLYSLDGGNLSITSQASLGDSYDQQFCAAGSAGVSVSLPRTMQDTGNVTLTPTSGSSLGITTYGKVNDSFSFWVELYHPYALDVTSANSLVVNNLLAAESQPVVVAPTTALNSTSGNSTALTWSMPMREGRYDMRAYFQNATSLDIVQSNLLILNDSLWVSLSDSCPPQSVQTQQVSYSASLAGGQAYWPRTVYLMYRTFGVEGVVSYPVTAKLSSVNFLASPWNESLSDVKVSVAPSSSHIMQTSQAGSIVYVLASSYPLNFAYSLDISGGQNVSQGSTTIYGSYSTQTLKVALSKLTIHLLSDQSAPSTVDITGPQGVNITSNLVGSNQTMSYLLPPGSYTVTGSQAGNTQSDQAALLKGEAAVVTLNFNTFLSFDVILVVTAALAAIANVVIWVLRSRSLSSRMASPSKGP